jgi:hypothetical protein
MLFYQAAWGCITSLAFIIFSPCRLLVGYLFVSISSITDETLFVVSMTCVYIQIYTRFNFI